MKLLWCWESLPLLNVAIILINNAECQRYEGISDCDTLLPFHWSPSIDFSYISRSHTVYLSVLYSADEGLRGRNVLQLIVDYFCYVFAHYQFAHYQFAYTVTTY